ncbi:MAG: nicotinate-nucleotide adenylyltransferase [Chitinophagaceae bacterium]|nr:MAG: nicotinate-nucleotide adenylyltransferase [Chitinophagaceae bacterium]
MKIGLYFGSFNPVHVGHLIIANHVLNETQIDKVWFVVSPQNPFKKNNSLLNEYDRLHLVRTAVEDDVRIKASDIEFYLPKPSYTIDTLTYLQEKYPDHNFSIIMGSDSFQNIDKWKNAEAILNYYPLYIYKRSGFEIKKIYTPRIKILDAPLLEISATKIRELVKQGKSIRYLVPEKIREEIENNPFFKKHF